MSRLGYREGKFSLEQFTPNQVISLEHQQACKTRVAHTLIHSLSLAKCMGLGLGFTLSSWTQVNPIPTDHQSISLVLKLLSRATQKHKGKTAFATAILKLNHN